MKAMKFFLFLLLALSPLAAFATPNPFKVNVSPSTITWDTNMWVSMLFTNDSSAGYAVDLTLYVDSDRNGVIGPQDLPVANFLLRDGETNQFGAVSIPHDEDGLTNRAIVTRIPFFGIDSPMHMVGNYIWKAVPTNNSIYTVTTNFSVTQPTSTVWITGRVVDYVTTNPVAAAYVQAFSFSSAKGNPPATWTDTNGAFRIDLPAAFSTADVQGVQCMAFGHFNATRREETKEWISAYLFENDLSAGANALTNDLRAVSAIPGVAYTLSGTLYDDQTNPIPRAIVSFGQNVEDDPGRSLTVTDTSGNFQFPVPDGVIGGIGGDGFFLNMRGYVASGIGPYNVTQDISGIQIFCPRATILARSTVTAAGTGTGVEGVEVEFDAGSLWNSGVSIAGGVYEVGLTSNSAYEADVSGDGLAPLGYARVNSYANLSITNAGVFTNAPFEVERVFTLAGAVYDRNTNALTDGEVGEFAYPSFNGWWEQSAQLNRHGQFVMLVVTGQYGVGADRFAGYMSQNYSNHFFWEWNDGVVADPVTVTTNGATNINFFLPQASYIRGTVYGTNAPLAGADVGANIGDNWRGGAQTDTNGMYELAVLPGTNYTVHAQGPSGGFFLYQCWSNKWQDSEADFVTTDTNAPATNINFDLPIGGRIEGTMYESDGFTPLTNANGRVEARKINDDGAGYGNVSMIDGTYGFTAVTTGVFRISAEANNWLRQYYNGFYEYQRDQANVITVEVGKVTGGIDFTMKQPSYVEGKIVSGGSAVTGVNTFVQYVADTSNWNTIFINATDSDSNGNYSIEVPPGSNFLVGLSLPDGSYFVQQYWSNVIQQQQSTLFVVETNSTVSNINFDLLVGMRIEGRVWNELGNPMESLWIDCSRFDTNGWWLWCAGDETDINGNYGFAVPAGTSYFVRVSRPWSVSDEDWWYPQTFFSNKFSDAEADQVQAGPGVTVSNVDFRLALGYRVEGFVYNSDGVNPAPNGFVGSLGPATNPCGGASCEGNGYYRLCLPNHLPLILFGNAQDRVPEYYNNVYSAEQATALQPAAMTTTRVDFALYRWDEDSDSDGVNDYQEDTRPDGIYKDAEDWASYTNSDTDGEGLNDREERDNYNTSPKLRDTDGDGFDDYVETGVTYTDPTATTEGSNSFLECAQTIRFGSNMVVRWAASTNAGNYYIQRSTNLLGGLYWNDLVGPLAGTGDVMTVTDSNAPPNSAYRVRIPY